MTQAGTLRHSRNVTPSCHVKIHDVSFFGWNSALLPTHLCNTKYIICNIYPNSKQGACLCKVDMLKVNVHALTRATATSKTINHNVQLVSERGHKITNTMPLLLSRAIWLVYIFKIEFAFGTYLRFVQIVFQLSGHRMQTWWFASGMLGLQSDFWGFFGKKNGHVSWPTVHTTVLL